QNTEHHAFNQQLANNLPPRGADSDANRNLALPAQHAAEHHIRDIGARDQQHASHRSQHEEKDQLDWAAVVPFLKSLNECADVLIRIGILGGQPVSNAFELRAGLRDRRAALEDSEDLERAVGALRKLRSRHKRHPQVLVIWKFEPFRHHADDGGRFPVHIHYAAGDIWGTAIAILPYTVP